MQVLVTALWPNIRFTFPTKWLFGLAETITSFMSVQSLKNSIIATFYLRESCLPGFKFSQQLILYESLYIL